VAHHDIGCGREALDARVIDPVVAGRAAAFDEDEAHLGEHLQVRRDGGLDNVDRCDDFAYGHRRTLAC